MTHNGVQLDLRVVPLESYGNLLQHFTGSKGHNVRMREEAQKRGLSVSEWGITNEETGEVFRTPDEDEVYRHLGYQPIPPELRENNGELELARRNELPVLVEVGDMRGDLHLHSDWSGDGKHPLLDVVAAVREHGHEYMAITDHSGGVGMGIGLEADDVRRQIEAVHLIRETLDGFELLAGCEVDIMGDGSLYLPDDLLGELDWVLASLHVAQRQDADRMTKRLLAAAEHPSVDAIGHPSGRMIGKREGYDFDVEAVVAACAEHGTFLEINAQPHRLDLRPAHARLAVAGRRQARDLDRRAPHGRARLPGARRLHGAPRGRDARRRRQRAAVRRVHRAAQAGQGRAHVSEPDRNSESLVFVSTGRRLAAAKVGRRWHEVRGPLLIGGGARLDPGAAAVRRAAHAPGPGPLAPLVRAHRGADDARARRLARPRARGLRTRRAARPGARGGDPRDGRGRARRPARRLRRRQRAGARLRDARAPRLRRGLGLRPRAACSRTRASAPTTTARACPRRPAPSTR